MTKTAVCVNTSVLFILQIFTVDDSYKVELQFTQSVEEVEKNKDSIVRCAFLSIVNTSLTLSN